MSIRPIALSPLLAASENIQTAIKKAENQEIASARMLLAIAQAQALIAIADNLNSISAALKNTEK